MSTTAALEFSEVRLRRGSRDILAGLTFTASRAEVTAIVGPNGAGKTTAFRCATGLLRPDAGKVTVLGSTPGSQSNRSRIGWMPQAPGSWSAIAAGDLLDYLARLYANPLPVKTLAAELGIDQFARTQFRRLSGGQKQSLNLAAAIIGRPEYVVLDEPTAGMDPHARRHVHSLIGTLRENGVGIALATHDMDEAALADRVHIMDAGRVVLSGTVAELTATADLEEVFLTHTTRRGAQ